MTVAPSIPVSIFTLISFLFIWKRRHWRRSTLPKFWFGVKRLTVVLASTAIYYFIKMGYRQICVRITHFFHFHLEIVGDSIFLPC